MSILHLRICLSQMIISYNICMVVLNYRLIWQLFLILRMQFLSCLLMTRRNRNGKEFFFQLLQCFYSKSLAASISSSKTTRSFLLIQWQACFKLHSSKCLKAVHKYLLRIRLQGRFWLTNLLQSPRKEKMRVMKNRLRCINSKWEF